MMKKMISALMALLLVLAIIPANAEEEKVLNILTWEGYIDSDTLTAFEQATGIKTVFSSASSNEEMMAKLQMNGGSEYDIVVISDYAVNILRKENLLAQLDTSKLANIGNLDEVYLSQYYDPENQYTIPYVAGTPLIVYDPAVVDIDITGYDDLWNPALSDSIAIMDDARNVIGITLKSLGYSMNTTDEGQLAEAKEKLMGLYQNIRVFDYETAYVALLNGEASVAYMFTPEVAWALDENPELKVVYPKEGMGFGIDSLVVPVNAPHPQNAMVFLDFILDGQVAANVALAQMYMTPNRAAYDYLPEEYLKNPALYIPDETLGKTEFIQDLGEYEEVYQQIWTDFKLQ